MYALAIECSVVMPNDHLQELLTLAICQVNVSPSFPSHNIPPGQLDMSTFTVPVRSMALFPLLAEKAMHVASEAVLQPTKVVFVFVKEMALRPTMRAWRTQQRVLSNIPVGVLLFEDEVPRKRQHMASSPTLALLTISG